MPRSGHMLQDFTERRPVGRDRCHRTGCRVGRCLRIGGQWEAWQSRCHFLMGSLCFDTWLAHSDGTIIQDHEADFESGYLISALIQITQRSVSPLKCGYRKLSWLCDPHLVTQLSQVDGLGPGCPTIFAALCFLQRSETGQCTVGP